MPKRVTEPYRRQMHPKGYVLVYVGVRHHLADKSGWAFEHRVVAERMLGRKLRPGEVVHHEDHARANNHPANLKIFPSTHAHNAYHRTRTERRRLPGEANEMVECECGCGARFLRFDAQGAARRFIRGHRARLQTRTRPLPWKGTGYVNRAKTHCKRGHQFTEKNTRTDRRGSRVCRACKAMHQMESRRARYQSQS